MRSLPVWRPLVIFNFFILRILILVVQLSFCTLMICPRWLLTSWLTVMYHHLIDLFLDTGTFSPMGMPHCSVYRCHPNNLSLSSQILQWTGDHTTEAFMEAYIHKTHMHCLFGIYKGLLLYILQWKSSNLLKWCYKRRSASWGAGNQRALQTMRNSFRGFIFFNNRTCRDSAVCTM